MVHFLMTKALPCCSRDTCMFKLLGILTLTYRNLRVSISAYNCTKDLNDFFADSQRYFFLAKTDSVSK